MCVWRFAAVFLPRVSVLFSEPKIPQSIDARTMCGMPAVSVLFSEPKIPQCAYTHCRERNVKRFSALQRAENSSIARERV